MSASDENMNVIARAKRTAQQRAAEDSIIHPAGEDSYEATFARAESIAAEAWDVLVRELKDEYSYAFVEAYITKLKRLQDGTEEPE